jgi:hypothetical protein
MPEHYSMDRALINMLADRELAPIHLGRKHQREPHRSSRCKRYPSSTWLRTIRKY